MGKIGIICPSRTRPHNISEVYKSWLETHPHKSELIIALDDDDYENYNPFIVGKGIKYEINPRIRLVPTLNLVANKYCDQYEYLGFIGDDHRFRTKWWDMQVYNRLKNEGKNAIVYGNDLLQGENLPTAVFLNSSIVKRLGYMVPPNLIHMYADNFWLELGQSLKSITYMEDIIIEHCHHVVGKAEHDALYDEVNSFTYHDMEAYTVYKRQQFETDVAKLR